MEKEKTVGKGKIRVVKDDITTIQVEGFVYYATEDLLLGSGHGNAIAVRGGPTIQEELRGLAPRKVGEAVVTAAGKLNAKHIVHAVGPAFQEPELEQKLEKTVKNALAAADKKGIKTLALPPMGAGFYGVPIDVTARIMILALEKHLSGKSKIEEAVIVVTDPRDFKPFAARLNGAS